MCQYFKHVKECLIVVDVLLDIVLDELHYLVDNILERDWLSLRDISYFLKLIPLVHLLNFADDPEPSLIDKRKMKQLEEALEGLVFFCKGMHDQHA
jgi:hypothetical protein